MKLTAVKKISTLPFFTKETLRQLEPSQQALNFNLKYWQKKEIILPLKKGFYILMERMKTETDKDGFLEYLANKLVMPSYVSLEYVLQKYALLSETIFTITSITTKTGRTFPSRAATFSYYSITSRLFLGFIFKNFYENKIIIASCAKALFDFLYLRSFKMKVINEKIIEELRMNWENFTKKDLAEFSSYVRLANNQKMSRVEDLIKRRIYA